MTLFLAILSVLTLAALALLGIVAWALRGVMKQIDEEHQEVSV